MAVLEDYIQKREEIYAACRRECKAELLGLVQEIEYRISVLATLKGFCKLAPVTRDMRTLRAHYARLCDYFQLLKEERRCGAKADDKGQKRREEGAKSFSDAVRQESRAFASFKADTDELYKKSIGQFICRIVPAWIAYRDLYTKI